MDKRQQAVEKSLNSLLPLSISPGTGEKIKESSRFHAGC